MKYGENVNFEQNNDDDVTKNGDVTTNYSHNEKGNSPMNRFVLRKIITFLSDFFFKLWKVFFFKDIFQSALLYDNIELN